MIFDFLKRMSWVAGILLAVPFLAVAGSNLVINGKFDSTNSFLYGWKYNYENTGNALYADNHLRVAVTNDGNHHNVLALTADYYILWERGQGVIVDSYPIPIQPGGRYKLTVSARSMGPNCRILVEGYRWRPGIRPHPHPKLSKLRKCYKFYQVYFGPRKAGVMGGIGSTWRRASQTFPDKKMKPLAQESFNKVKFLVVHIVAIDVIHDDVAKGGEYSLFVDDVVLERLN